MTMKLVPLMLAGAAALSACSAITEGFGLGSRDGVAQLAEWRCDAPGPIDMDADGLVRASEWSRYSRLAYSAWDEDGNGRVTRAEFDDCWGTEQGATVQPASAAESAWAAFNPDGNDYLSSYEFWSQATWTRLDANRNGVADAGEWTW